MKMKTRSNNNILPKPTGSKPRIIENTRPLSFTFNVLSVSGVWLPLGWESRKFFKNAYQLLSACAVLATYILVALQVVLIACSKFDVNFLVDIMFTLLTALSVCFKMMNFLVRRKQVIQLREMLMEDWCMPRDDVERERQKKTDEFIKNFTIGFNVIAQATLFVHLITPLCQDSSSRKLPFNLWLPYDLRYGLNYWITYGLEIIPSIIGILVNATTDVIVSGFVLQACTQLDFLKHRLNQLPNLVKAKLMKALPVDELQKNLLKQLVEHHNFVIKFAKNVTRTFDVIIVEQYIASVLLFSVIVYKFIVGDIPLLQKLMAFGYIICMTAELFAYCWCGNEITLKSSELGVAIFRMDWMVLNKETSKALKFIMLRTSKPIVMSYGGLILLNIDSFKTILKVTYSAFNVLKKSTA